MKGNRIAVGNNVAYCACPIVTVNAFGGCFEDLFIVILFL
jgi:hypothetical protein